MNRSAKRRHRANARQLRANRTQIRELIAAGKQTPLHRFAIQDGLVVAENVHYSDEESE